MFTLHLNCEYYKTGLGGRDGAVLSFVHFSCHFAKTWLWELLPVFS